MRRSDICLYLGPADSAERQALLNNRNTPRERPTAAAAASRTTVTDPRATKHQPKPLTNPARNQGAARAAARAPDRRRRTKGASTLSARLRRDGRALLQRCIPFNRSMSLHHKLQTTAVAAPPPAVSRPRGSSASASATAWGLVFGE
jgi:hypothetical protein